MPGWGYPLLMRGPSLSLVPQNGKPGQKSLKAFTLCRFLMNRSGHGRPRQRGLPGDDQAYTGFPGDGRTFVTDVEASYTLRTGEAGL